MATNHENFRASLIKFCQQAIADLGMGSFVDFDAHAELTDLPEGDLVGIGSFHWTNDGSFYTVGCAIGVSTWDDPNNFRHNQMLGLLSERLKVEDKIDVVDADTGAVIGWMVVEAGVSLMPMMKTETRSLQSFLVSFQTSITT